MAYETSDEVDKVAHSSEGSDDVTLTDFTSCMGDADTGTACFTLERLVSIISARVETDKDPALIDELGTVNVRLYVDSIGSSGDVFVQPYIDDNSVDSDVQG